jgi:chemotaxis response regulator CheB
VLVVDQHEIVRKGLEVLLEKLESVDIVGKAANSHSALQLANDLRSPARVEWQKARFDAVHADGMRVWPMATRRD